MSLNLVPLPNQIHQHPGSLDLLDIHSIVATGEGAKFPAEWLRQIIEGRTGKALSGEGGVALTLIDEENKAETSEVYNLHIGAKGIHISGSAAGLMRGTATLAQLLEQSDQELPFVDIQDRPRFAYRGFMLDVSRHFMPLDDVKALIRELAHLKFNTFHWHLTDDQGWRIEIKRYPKLTEVGAWRERTLKGHALVKPFEYAEERHGGFYTQEEIRDLVAYAAERSIQVIPEIDLPGHARAALAAYPELSCSGQAVEVWDHWGITDDVYCTRERSFEFLQNVMDEVIGLFPSRTIHIGGDEVRTKFWADCPDCRAVMEREGLTDPKQLEAYFIGRMTRYLTDKGVRVIGWDEITEGELPLGVTVMSWRGFEGGIKAAQAGFNVIMSPQSHVYLDHYQGEKEKEPLAIGGFSDLAKTYDFEPVPPQLSEEQREHILGGQANLWREYVPTTEHAHYMTFPRLHAIAEVLWTDAERRDWTDFVQRLPHVLSGLTQRGIGSRPLDADLSGVLQLVEQ